MLILVALAAAPAAPGLPPAGEMVDFPFQWSAEAPGAFDAAGLLDKPAGRLGPVVVKDGHFYTGEQRIRFWGVNICFAGCFPTHEQADKVAARLAHFGVNAVRFHHMDMQKFPNGIFADDTMETLHPEALDRLDYFIAQLKKNGIYANLNLHVSRTWSKTHKWENAAQIPESFDKILDIFHPELIAANKQYARDLLTHVNKYTQQAYAAEPAVAMVEINNEDTIFLWGGEQALDRLPEPYASLLQKLWNQWLVKKYGTREKVWGAWNAGAQPLGANLAVGKWNVEAHNGAAMSVATQGGEHRLTITKLSGTDWHCQFSTPGLKVKRGDYFTVSFTASADKDRSIGVGVAQAHAPWNNLGLATPLKITSRPKEYRFGFTASEDDENGRVSFTVGQATGVITLADVQFRSGGQEGLRDNEDPAKGTVARPNQGVSPTRPRMWDWYLFLQETDESYFVGMREFLRNELKVRAPITGTIGLGPLGTLSQSKMDFVDAHAYWEHPHFPRRPWDPRDWVIGNKPMVENPEGATLWRLAAVRVHGKPFTVTEYNHSAPNEWQAECMPMIAAYAATQDWDGIFLFSYVHGSDYERSHATSYFDIEGSPLKMHAMPIGARIFLGQRVAPIAAPLVIGGHINAMLEYARESYYDVWTYARRAHKIDWRQMLTQRAGLVFQRDPARQIDNSMMQGSFPNFEPIKWTRSGEGTGQFTLNDPHAAAFAGFARQGQGAIEIGGVQITKLDSPFAVISVVPADPSKTIASADRLLISAMARGENTGMKWNENHTSVSNNWGGAPTRIEVVKATLKLPADYTVRALDAAGKVIKESQTINKTLTLGEAPTVWYELVRK